MWIDQSQLDIRKVAYLDEHGKALRDVPVPETELIGMYEWMVRARVFDQRAVKMQRQGRIGTYPPLQGQEAAQIGSAFALGWNDWVYPSYREIGVSLVRGVPMSQYLLHMMGHLKGLTQEGTNVFPIQVIIGAQILHAVGGAWASQNKGEESVSVAYIGDGGTSEGDFHEGLNFAGIYKLPVIFFVQNNQWAISLPVGRQTASSTIAQKALAYGITGVRVDGNDAVAVYTVMKEAIAKAKAGEPVLIEAVTFRRGPHTTADDPAKYRPADDERKWTARDPLTRLKTYLTEHAMWDDAKDRELYEKANTEVSEAFRIASSVPASELKDVFENVYETKPAQLREQQVQVEEAGSQ